MIEFSLITDVGLLRQNNEDNYYVNGQYRTDLTQGHAELHGLVEDEYFVGAVFDGMGGEECGEVASYEAAKCLSAYQDSDFGTIASTYVTESNHAVCKKMDMLVSGRMGSTMSVVQIREEKLSLCNLGDSPVYLFRSGCLKQLSVNHNEAQSMFEMGLISEEEIRHCKGRHRLTQHLGIYEDEMIIEPFVLENVQLEKGDCILICSDGLTDMLEDEQIRSLLNNGDDVQRMTENLICCALENGGKDNVTVLLLKQL